MPRNSSIHSFRAVSLFSPVSIVASPRLSAKCAAAEWPKGSIAEGSWADTFGSAERSQARRAASGSSVERGELFASGEARGAAAEPAPAPAAAMAR
jgi:hypothetical protein